MWPTVFTLVIGIAVGVAGNALYQFLRETYFRATDRVRLKGFWGERIHEGTDRVNSLGHIHYDFRRLMWVFDGTNYHNDGRPFCHFRTIASHYDRQAKKFYYVFENIHENAVHASYTGFGVLTLSKSGKAWTPSRGAFAAGNPGECFRSHTMQRLDYLPSTQEGVVATFSKLGDDPRKDVQKG